MRDRIITALEGYLSVRLLTYGVPLDQSAWMLEHMRDRSLREKCRLLRQTVKGP